jgi:hypothetical protein
MSLKSKTCTGKQTGRPRSEYGTEREAREHQTFTPKLTDPSAYEKHRSKKNTAHGRHRT